MDKLTDLELSLEQQKIISNVYKKICQDYRDLIEDMNNNEIKWIKIETKFDPESGYNSNVPFGEMLIFDGNRVQYIDEHGWDKDEYYFHNGCGKVDNVTHWMPLPKPPK
jgi:hypothetical protein